MRYHFLIGVCLTVFSTVMVGQQYKSSLVSDAKGFELGVTTNLSSKQLKKSGANTIVDYSEYTQLGAAGTYKLPYQELIIALPPNSKPKVYMLVEKTNTIQNATVTLNPDLKILSDTSYKIEEQFVPSKKVSAQTGALEVKGYFWYRDLYCVNVRVRLADYNYSSNSVSEVVSYKLKFDFPENYFLSLKKYIPRNKFEEEIGSVIANADMAENFRSTPAKSMSDTAGGWINYPGSYIKIGVAEDRIYRLSKTELDTYNIPSGIDPRTFRMYCSGVEVPLFVQGQSDGVFDAADYIEFYGTKNYSPYSPRIIAPDGVPYNEYLNKFSDTSSYFLTWGDSTGKRVAEKTSDITGVTDTLGYYTCFIHNEPNLEYQDVSVDNYKNSYADSLDAKTWFAGYFFDFADAVIPLQVSDVVKGKNATFYSRFISVGSNRESNSHSVLFGYKTFTALSSDTNTTAISIKSVNRNAKVVLSGAIPSDSLKSGENKVVLRTWKNGTSPNYLLYDWVELEYPRTLKAQNDSLYFEIRDSLSIAPRIIKIDNVVSNASDMTVYRIKPNIAKISGAVNTGSKLYFADSVGLGYAYYVIQNSKITSNKPATMKSKKFINLRGLNRPVDYITVTHSSLFNAARNYTGFIKNNYGVDTLLVSVDDIYDEFSFGVPDPSSIREFLRAAFSGWVKQPTYLFLLGQACYDYKKNFFAKKGYASNTNLVPSYGEPVSDTWFVQLNDAGSNPSIQQMFVGRVPASTEEDVVVYLGKHTSYVSQKYDLWNKRALLFSGGDNSDSLQLLQLKLVNDRIIRNYVSPAPLSMNYDHFYKTSNPPTDFGPFEPNYVSKAIEAGGLFISYIGHSGTRTWDNSISDPNQLLNKVKKSPLVSDFGCSTNKFAEPDVKSFGALFVNGGQTIGYIGNSSLGFTSTSVYLPDYFYESILRDTVLEIGRAHFRAKEKMFSLLGKDISYRIFSLSNLLLGDPIVKVAIPPKPNLHMDTLNIERVNTESNDRMMYDTLRIVYHNWGRATVDSVEIGIKDTYESAVVIDTTIKVRPIGFVDTLITTIRINNRPNDHLISVELDPNKKITEIDEDDNKQQARFTVSKLTLLPNITSDFPVAVNPVMTIMSPATQLTENVSEMVVEYDSTKYFLTPTSKIIAIDSFFTKVSFATLPLNKRCWGRVKFNQSDTAWSKLFPLYRSTKNIPFYLDDAYSFASQQSVSGMNYESGMKLSKDTAKFTIKSGSGNFSKYGSILKNGENILGNTFTWGMGIAILDPVTLNVDYARTYEFGGYPFLADSMAGLINKTPTGKYVLICAIDDAASNLKDTLKNAIRACGSKLIDVLGFREPWILFGKKGAAQGTVSEVKMPSSYQDILSFDSTIVVTFQKGVISTQSISRASKMNSVVVDATIPLGARVNVKPIGINTGGTHDTTLSTLSFTASNTADISGLNPANYAGLYFDVSLLAANDGSTPVLKSFGVSYDESPELVVNYQSFSLGKDTIRVGKPNTVNLTMANAGKVKADSIRVVTEIVNSDGTTPIKVGDNILASIPPESKYSFSFDYNGPYHLESPKFRVTVDPENKIREYIDFIDSLSNNNIALSGIILVNEDTTKPSIKVYADGNQIFDGDFVNKHPKLKFELNDFEKNDHTTRLLDSANMEIYFNGEKLMYQDTSSLYHLTYAARVDSPKLVVDYVPGPNHALEPGDNDLRILGQTGSKKSYKDTTLTLNVASSMQVKYVFNYPNPFKDVTYFTFQVSDVPEEVAIKIYTVAGRLIKNIKRTSAELTSGLSTGFNKSISWDGRDEDGNPVANGVYIYKVLIKKDGKVIEEKSKLAVMR